LYRSSPSKCIGVEKICIAAGVRNCAVFNLPDSVDNSFENCWRRGFGTFAGVRRPARIEGRLKDAKIVMLSLSANRARLILGMVEVGVVDEPNIRANWESL
jgi:hypothetical protein